MSQAAVAYEAPIYVKPKNPASRFARLGPHAAPTPGKPLPYEVRDGVRLEHLAPHGCRYPVGTPGAGLFCGARKDGRRPYCAEHLEKVGERPVDPKEVERFVAMGLRIAAGKGPVR